MKICKLCGNPITGKYAIMFCSKSCAQKYNSSLRKKRTQEEFLVLAKKAHGDKYDYSRTVYIKDRIKSRNRM